MCDIAVSVIQEYIYEHFFCPVSTWDECEFRKRCYQRWAAYEIMHRIMDHPFDPPLRTLEEFVIECSMYATCGENTNRNFIFICAVETAEELSLLFV